MNGVKKTLRILNVGLSGNLRKAIWKKMTKTVGFFCMTSSVEFGNLWIGKMKTNTASTYYWPSPYPFLPCRWPLHAPLISSPVCLNCPPWKSWFWSCLTCRAPRCLNLSCHTWCKDTRKGALYFWPCLAVTGPTTWKQIYVSDLEFWFFLCVCPFNVDFYALLSEWIL